MYIVGLLLMRHKLIFETMAIGLKDQYTRYLLILFSFFLLYLPCDTNSIFAFMDSTTQILFSHDAIFTWAKMQIVMLTDRP